MARSGESRMDRLERECRELQARLEDEIRKNAVAQDQLRNDYASVNAVLNNLRNQVQVLRGEVEETVYSLNRHAQDYKRFQEDQEKFRSGVYQDCLDRLTRLENSLGLVASDAKADESPGAGTEAVAAQEVAPETVLNEQELYAAGIRMFDAGNFAAARITFEQFLKQYPASRESDNAFFWIGETYFRENSYEKAILKYQEVIDKFPDGNKLPAALLKQGMAFNRIKDDINSRLVLKRLISEFPDSQEAKEAGKLLEEL